MKKQDKDGFYKVMAINDWGCVQYFLGGSASEPFGTHSLQEQDQSMRLKNNDKVKVKWPDGKVTNEVVTVEDSYQEVHDHGHSDTVKGDRAFLKLKWRGKVVEVDCDGLRMKRR